MSQTINPLRRATAGGGRPAGHRALAGLVLGLGSLLVWPSSEGAAAAPCAPREILVQRLADGYGEAPRALGLTGNGALLELLVSPGGRSFSILMTRPPSAGAPGRISCLVAAGEGWRPAAPVEVPGEQRGRES
ncbi:MAG: hypothetical protein QNJ30_12165 [Kiloniellales bacterium]|nr:hypothetical protein [Kiloniellales bacterium]